ncbi:hybrid sensor histidine kinase/response regulator [Bosea sp. NBC_00550]|uniref:hybrid sensor histidine kinase/response regulator n=1 Tax=Bosea sp. NBC_00550 TaxID=2969621 RepID=UPI0029FF07F8|nr:PAS domain S-box protein [Bosea sp. NBC_00550]
MAPQNELSDSRYRILVDAITDYAIYMLDAAGLVASWNPGAQRFKGYQDHEILGEHFSRFYTASDIEADLPSRALATARAEGRFESEGWRVRKDGSQFWAHVVIDPVIDPQTRQVLGYAKITRDLTERREQERALRESEQSFRLLVQGVTDYAIFMLDEKGFVTNWNAGAERIKGYRPDEIIGRHFSVFYTPEDHDRREWERALAKARANDGFQTEGWRVRKNGERFWASVAIDPIYNDSGSIMGFAKITRDMTERKRAEIALDTAREALYQSQKMEAVGQLTGGIAHDFNNLLNAVVGSLELLRKRLTDDRQMSLINNAMEGASRGISLTQRMLAFARKQELQATPISVFDLMGAMSDLLRRSLGPSVNLDFSLPADLDNILVDRNQLELAILNLTVNARDAMPEGGRITISAKNIDAEMSGPAELKPGRYVQIIVVDEGVGMAPDVLAKAVEPFFTTKGIGKGTGLGLPMILGTAQQLGGRLELKSELGKGTTAILWLPAAEPAIPSTVTAEETITVEEPGSSLRILAVDDDALILMNTVALLEDLGHTVVEANSGSEALEKLESEESFDLLITDHAMPKMTGGQLIAEVTSRWPDIPIILASGYAEIPETVLAGVERLAKPFWQADLHKAICNATRLKPGPGIYAVSSGDNASGP